MDILISEHVYFSPGEAGHLGFELLGCGQGRRQGSPSLKTPPLKKGRILDSYALVYLSEGSGVFQSASQVKTVVKAGTVFFLFPGEWHAYGPAENGFWCEHWLLFDGPAVRQMHQRGEIHEKKPILLTGKLDGAETIFNGILKAAAGPEKDFLALQLIRVLYLTTRSASSSHASAMDPVVGKITSRIRQNPAAPWDFRVLAAGENVSYSLLRKKFATVLGLPPAKFLMLERMRLAAKLLAAGGRVGEVARQLGMDDPYHFSRLFRKAIGKSPRAWLQSLMR